MVKDINSRPPQPEDPERSLDPDSKEDPDISVELIDGVFTAKQGQHLCGHYG